MRFRLTKLQMKMLAEGKELRFGHIRISPDDAVKEMAKKLVDSDFMLMHDVFLFREKDELTSAWVIEYEKKKGDI